VFEDLIYALQNFKHNKIRTMLSLLGVIIGVASVIIIATLGESAKENVSGSFGSAGLDMVTISSGFGARRNSVSIQFNETFREELWNRIPDLKTIKYVNSLNATIAYGDYSVSSNISSVEYGHLEMYNYELEYGNYFTVSDDVNGMQKIILGSGVAEALFPEGNAVGRSVFVIVSDVRFGFEVVGVLKAQSVGMGSSSSAVYIPRGFYSKKISPDASASQVVVQVIDQDNSSTVADNITAFLTEKTGNSGSYNVSSMQSMIEQYNEVIGTITMLLSGIAAISLLVGGVGIMNIMIVTVIERRKEIGIRKALGAAPGAIMSQFLVESATITLCGGLLGILVGIGISAVAVYIMDWQFAVKWSACLLSFFFSAFVGVFFGFSPAARAAKLDPVEVLASD
jgi:putative ABC transport system permease protein